MPMIFETKYYDLLSRKHIWNCRLQNGDHFVKLFPGFLLDMLIQFSGETPEIVMDIVIWFFMYYELIEAEWRI